MAYTSRVNLVTAETIYRLALLVLGDTERAEAATWRALRGAASGQGIAELAPALLQQRVRSWHYQPSSRLLGRAGLAPEKLEALLEALAALTPAQRLALGLSMFRGLPWMEAAATAGAGGRRPADPRYQLGVVLELVPQLASDAAVPVVCHRCSEAIQRDEEELGRAMRQHLAECERCQQVRWGWRQTQELLRAALPALFVVAPEVLRRLAGPAPTTSKRGRWYPYGLLVAVVGLLVVLVLRDTSRVSSPADATEVEALTSQELIERVITRFDYPPAGGSVVHEVVEFETFMLRPRSQSRGPVHLRMERWYDYGTPQRVRLEVKEGNKLAYAIAADGHGQIQLDTSELSRIRIPQGPGNGDRLTLRLSAEDEAQLVPLLRQPYFVGNMLNIFNRVVPPPLPVLALARANPSGVQPLGTTSVLERPAWLLSVAGEGQRYLVAIDRETYALLEVRDVSEGAKQKGAQLWRTTQLEVLEALPATTFQLGGQSWGRTIAMPLPLLYFHWLNIEPVPLPAQHASPLPLLLPDPHIVPASEQLMIWNFHDEPGSYTAFLHEYGMVSLIQLYGPKPAAWTYEEAGVGFNLHNEVEGQLVTNEVTAFVDTSSLLPNEPATNLMIRIALPLLTPEEREALVRDIIRSLRPADDQLLKQYPVFRVRAWEGRTAPVRDTVVREAAS